MTPSKAAIETYRKNDEFLWNKLYRMGICNDYIVCGTYVISNYLYKGDDTFFWGAVPLWIHRLILFSRPMAWPCFKILGRNAWDAKQLFIPLDFAFDTCQPFFVLYTEWVVSFHIFLDILWCIWNCKTCTIKQIHREREREKERYGSATVSLKFIGS